MFCRQSVFTDLSELNYDAIQSIIKNSSVFFAEIMTCQFHCKLCTAAYLGGSFFSIFGKNEYTVVSSLFYRKAFLYQYIHHTGHIGFIFSVKFAQLRSCDSIFISSHSSQIDGVGTFQPVALQFCCGNLMPISVNL